MAVAHARAEVGGRGDVLPAGCLEARLLLPLLVPLLGLALAHPGWGQGHQVITGRYSRCRWWRRRQGRKKKEEKCSGKNTDSTP